MAGERSGVQAALEPSEWGEAWVWGGGGGGVLQVGGRRVASVRGCSCQVTAVSCSAYSRYSTRLFFSGLVSRAGTAERRGARWEKWSGFRRGGSRRSRPVAQL